MLLLLGSVGGSRQRGGCFDWEVSEAEAEAQRRTVRRGCRGRRMPADGRRRRRPQHVEEESREDENARETLLECLFLLSD